jgi:hydrogenase maturation factor
MCLGVPGRVTEIRKNDLGMAMGTVSFGGIALGQAAVAAATLADATTEAN